jgi:signal transduction histidine kinase
LRNERAKLDAQETQRQQLERRTQEGIHADRASADAQRSRDRADADQTMPSAAAALVDAERIQFDKALRRERETIDAYLHHERLERRLLAEALAGNERQETELSLLRERIHSEQEALEAARSLREEQTDHALTKATLAFRDQTVAMVSHDLKNPTVAISLGVRLLRKRLSRDPLDREDIGRHLELIEQNAHLIDRMISALLDIEKLARGQFPLHARPGDVGFLLHESLTMFGPIAASKSCTLSLTVPDGALWASFDHDRLLQVLSNLIGNAIKCTPPGGHITLAACHREEGLEVSVADSGPGIAEADQDKLFHKFSQIQRDETGLGLGLYIAKSIVEALGGRIWLESHPGQGAKFRFSLPS